MAHLHQLEETIRENLIDVLRRQGYSRICASQTPGMEKPTPITWPTRNKGYVPDVTAIKNGIEYIFDIETEDNLTSASAEGSLKILSAYAEQTGQRFYVVVPQGSEEQAMQVLEDLHIRNASVLMVSRDRSKLS